MNNIFKGSNANNMNKPKINAHIISAIDNQKSNQFFGSVDNKVAAHFLGKIKKLVID